MNRNTIKFIAAFTMFLDHFAAWLLEPSSTIYLVFRILGRTAFVLFAYMLVEGFFKTSNLKKYFFRLLIFAATIEFVLLIFYAFTKENYLISFNVIWPLVFGLLGLILLKQDNIYMRLLVIPIVFIAEYINISYGAYGVLMILFFALYRNKVTQFILLIALNLLFIDVPLLSYIGLENYARYNGVMWIQWFSLVSFVFIFLYNSKKGKLNTKWFFYIFYPTHVGLIFLISWIK